MPYTQTIAGWVREEIQAIEGFFIGGIGCVVKIGFVPASLPLSFNGVRVIGF